MIESLVASFVTGLASSIGPCAAPRYLIAAAAFLRGAAPGAIGLFVVGSLSGYVILGSAGVAMNLWLATSPLAYLALALSLLVSAALTLSGDHARHYAFVGPQSWGRSVLLGAASTLLAAPCCLPIWIALGMEVAFAGDELAATAILTSFALGHFTPLAAGVGLKNMLPKAPRAWNDATATVSGSLLAATGLFFAVLA